MLWSVRSSDVVVPMGVVLDILKYPLVCRADSNDLYDFYRLNRVIRLYRGKGLDHKVAKC